MYKRMIDNGLVAVNYLFVGSLSAHSFVWWCKCKLSKLYPRCWSTST